MSNLAYYIDIGYRGAALAGRNAGYGRVEGHIGKKTFDGRGGGYD